MSANLRLRGRLMTCNQLPGTIQRNNNTTNYVKLSNGQVFIQTKLGSEELKQASKEAWVIEASYAVSQVLK